MPQDLLQPEKLEKHFIDDPAKDADGYIPGTALRNHFRNSSRIILKSYGYKGKMPFRIHYVKIEKEFNGLLNSWFTCLLFLH